MNRDDTNRRRLLTAAFGAGLAAFAPGHANGQEVPKSPQLPFSPRAAGEIHRQALGAIGGILAGTPLNSVDGMKKLVEKLVQSEVITKAEAQIIEDVIDKIFGGMTIDALSESIKDIYKRIAETAGQVAVAILSIAVDSVAYVKKLGEKIDPKRAMEIIVADLQGTYPAQKSVQSIHRGSV